MKLPELATAGRDFEVFARSNSAQKCLDEDTLPPLNGGARSILQSLLNNRNLMQTFRAPETTEEEAEDLPHIVRLELLCRLAIASNMAELAISQLVCCTDINQDATRELTAGMGREIIYDLVRSRPNVFSELDDTTQAKIWRVVGFDPSQYTDDGTPTGLIIAMETLRHATFVPAIVTRAVESRYDAIALHAQEPQMEDPGLPQEILEQRDYVLCSLFMARASTTPGDQTRWQRNLQYHLGSFIQTVKSQFGSEDTVAELCDLACQISKIAGESELGAETITHLLGEVKQLSAAISFSNVNDDDLLLATECALDMIDVIGERPELNSFFTLAKDALEIMKSAVTVNDEDEPSDTTEDPLIQNDRKSFAGDDQEPDDYDAEQEENPDALLDKIDDLLDRINKFEVTFTLENVLAEFRDGDFRKAIFEAAMLVSETLEPKEYRSVSLRVDSALHIAINALPEDHAYKTDGQFSSLGDDVNLLIQLTRLPTGRQFLGERTEAFMQDALDRFNDGVWLLSQPDPLATISEELGYIRNALWVNQEYFRDSKQSGNIDALLRTTHLIAERACELLWISQDPKTQATLTNNATEMEEFTTYVMGNRITTRVRARPPLELLLQAIRDEMLGDSQQ